MKIIGYKPIYEPGPGKLSTQAFVFCSLCKASISGTGGPVHDALCVGCLSAPVKVAATAARVYGLITQRDRMRSLLGELSSKHGWEWSDHLENRVLAALDDPIA